MVNVTLYYLGLGTMGGGGGGGGGGVIDGIPAADKNGHLIDY